jgi:hypothetical protein
MPKKVANKDLPPVADVPGGEALVARLEKKKATFAKASEGAEKKDPKVRAARKQVKRAQRKLRKARMHTADKGAKPAAAEG